ncbi:hypothetical protein SOASR030_33350 [Leminorella grimontii]|uniref:Uncharacterized protein n=1 Tax=Leminorella grimontii TaxID=82981 RepID=A0AAV5N524_9GAMM|nr:hypothetical protein SOASR030_33350 [Leminorella grimontii]
MRGYSHFIQGNENVSDLALAVRNLIVTEIIKLGYKSHIVKFNLFVIKFD